MPTYIYQCPECGEKLDVHHSISTDPVIMCDACLVEMVRKPINAAISFSGDWMAKR